MWGERGCDGQSELRTKWLKTNCCCGAHKPHTKIQLLRLKTKEGGQDITLASQTQRGLQYGEGRSGKQHWQLLSPRCPVWKSMPALSLSTLAPPLISGSMLSPGQPHGHGRCLLYIRSSHTRNTYDCLNSNGLIGAVLSRLPLFPPVVYHK